MAILLTTQEQDIGFHNDSGLRPPLKWAGGKRWLVPQLKLVWEKHKDRRLVEPFCGGLAVALGLMPQEALLNDINPHAINFYSWLKKGLKIKLEMANHEATYYECRKSFNDLIRANKQGSRQAAEFFYYLNRTGYNGLCRFNRKGEFNVPFGSYKKINYINNFLQYRSVFEKWEFTTSDFETVSVLPNDLIYADPPYDVEFTHYSKEGFSWEDQVRLAGWLAKHRGPVIVSNQATDRIVALYKKLGFSISFLSAPRMINCTGDRTRAEEILAFKGV